LSAEDGVVNLNQAVGLVERHCALLAVVGGAAHGIRFAAVRALRPIHRQRPEDARRDDAGWE